MAESTAATTTTPQRFTVDDIAAAESKFFTQEHGRKFVTEMIKIKDLNNNSWVAKTHGRCEWKDLADRIKAKVLKRWEELPFNDKQAVIAAVNFRAWTYILI